MSGVAKNDLPLSLVPIATAGAGHARYTSHSHGAQAHRTGRPAKLLWNPNFNQEIKSNQLFRSLQLMNLEFEFGNILVQIYRSSHDCSVVKS